MILATTEVRLVLINSGELNAYQQFIEFIENNRRAVEQEQQIAAQGGRAVQCGEAAGPPTVTPASEPVAVVTPDVPPTDEAVISALRDYVARKGVDEAVKLLAEFGAKRAGDVKPEQRADFIRKMTLQVVA